MKKMNTLIIMNVNLTMIVNLLYISIIREFVLYKPLYIIKHKSFYINIFIFYLSNMNNKILLLFFLIVLSKEYQPARDFVTSFLKAAENKTEITLNDQCFGSDFDNELIKVVKYFKEEKFTFLLLLIKKMGSEIYYNCPSGDFIALYKEIKTLIENKEILQQWFPKIVKVGVYIYKLLTQGEVNISIVGEYLGKIIYTIMQSKVDPIL